MKKIISSIVLSAVMLLNSGTAIISSADDAASYDQLSSGLGRVFEDDNDKYYQWKESDCEKQPHIIGYFARDTWIGIDFKIKNSWVEIPDDYDSNEIHGYNYKVQMKINGKWKNVSSGKGYSNTAYVENLKPYTTYRLRLCIPHYGDYWYNKGGYKAYSEEIVVRTTPSQTKITSTSRSRTAVRLNWKKVKCAGYKIQVQNPVNKTWHIVKTVRDKNITTARITGLEPGTKYRFRVKAFGKVPRKKFPAMYTYEDTIDAYFSHNLWAKASKPVTVKTKK